MYVVGTAGHVDHGKSTLVKTLTGIDPDRWEEEQRREMTIDLGFAWLRLPDQRLVSLIDVPGHERFIKNMLAGVGGIDAVLLIIAADESVMPQTEEHLAILDLLQIQHGVIVLTKCDLVEPDWLALVQEDVRARLAGTCLADAPLVPISARTGQGLPLLLETLANVLTKTPARTDLRGLPRLPIDRSFTIGGFGTVVTGTLIDGAFQVGDEVEILPAGLRARIRGLLSHQQREQQAMPGSRVAVNLAGVSHHAINRGDVLTLPGRMQPTSIIDARLRLITTGRAVAQNDRFDMFVGASEAPCRATLLDREQLEPGESGWVQFRLERPIAVARGDRYILRQPSPGLTIGGGRIIDPHPARHRRFRPEVLEALATLERGTPADLVERVFTTNLPVAYNQILQATSLPERLVNAALDALLEQQRIMCIGQTPPAGWYIQPAAWETLVQKTVTVLEGYHRRYPLRSGMPREELRSRLKLVGDGFDQAIITMRDRAIIATNETSVSITAYQPALDQAQHQIVTQFLALCQQSPYAPPVPALDGEVLAYLIDQGKLVRVTSEVVFLPEPYQLMLAWVDQQLTTTGSVTVAQFRDRFTTSRKYALALLEHLDERKITRRDGDIRVRYSRVA